MADKKIADANLKSNPSGAEEIPVNDSGSDKKITVSGIVNTAVNYLFGLANKDALDDADKFAINGTNTTTWGNIKSLISTLVGTFDSLFFNTNYTPASTIEGELYWDGNWHTINYNTGLGATIKVGQTVYDVFYNDTGATIQPFKALHLKSAALFNGVLYPTFELADASDYEKIQGTITINCCAVLDGELGVCVRDATKLEGGDTSSMPGEPQLYVANDGSGDLTGVKPEFPSAAISIGGRFNSEPAPNGAIYVNLTSTFGDIFHEAWDGSIIESFNFTTSSDGAIITGLLENVNPLLNLTLNFSSGTFRLDTTTAPLTIELIPGTDASPITNYVYIPKSTKVLTVVTDGWPVEEHCRVAQLEVQSALTTQADGGTLGNQNINDHIKKEDDNGHILHIAAWIRKQFATWDSGTEATFDNTGGNGYINITSGTINQLHEQTVGSFSMPTDSIRIWNDESGNKPKITNLTSITTFSNGNSWNNSWGKIIVWRVANKTGEYSPVFLNKPSAGYNSEANAISDLAQYADYTIPNQFKTKAVLIGSFVFRISGGVITYVSGYEDLRGTLPIAVAGGGTGGGGVSTYLALTDTPSTRIGKKGQVLVCNDTEAADVYEPKGIFYNALRTFYASFNLGNLTANRTITWQDRDIVVAANQDYQHGSRIESTYSAFQTATDPGTGKFKLNAGRTEIYISYTQNQDSDIKAWLELIASGTVLKLQGPGNKYIWAKATGAITDNTTWATIPISVDNSEITTISDGEDFGFILDNPAGSTGGHTIQNEGTSLAQRTNLNFVGEKVTASDDSGNDATVVTIENEIPAVTSGEKIVSKEDSGTVNLDLTPIEQYPALGTLPSQDFSTGQATYTGIKGQVAYDSTYKYECIATDTWIRGALTKGIIDLYLTPDIDDSGGDKTSAELDAAYASAVVGQRVWGSNNIYEKKATNIWRKTPTTTA